MNIPDDEFYEGEDDDDEDEDEDDDDEYVANKDKYDDAEEEN